MAEYRSARRYYLFKRCEAAALSDGNAEVWQAKQEAEPGTALPADFPHLSALQAAGYTTDTDIDGADVAELTRLAGLSSRQGQAVLDALALL